MEQLINILGELGGAGVAASLVVAWLNRQRRAQADRDELQDKAQAEFEAHVDRRLDIVESRLDDIVIDIKEQGAVPEHRGPELTPVEGVGR